MKFKTNWHEDQTRYECVCLLCCIWHENIRTYSFKKQTPDTFLICWEWLEKDSWLPLDKKQIMTKKCDDISGSSIPLFQTFLFESANSLVWPIFHFTIAFIVTWGNVEQQCPQYNCCPVFHLSELCVCVQEPAGKTQTADICHYTIPKSLSQREHFLLRKLFEFFLYVWVIPIFTGWNWRC